VSAGSYAAESGAVLGIVLVLLTQQFGYIALGGLVEALEYLIVAAVVGAVVFGLIGMMLGRRYLRNHPEPPSASS